MCAHDLSPGLPSAKQSRQKTLFRALICAAAMLLALIVLLSSLRTIYWSGRGVRTLKFAVFDATSTLPLPDVEIVVFWAPSELGVGASTPEPDETDYRTQHLSTDASGNAASRYEFFAYGHENWFTDFGRVRIGDRYVRVTAAGYEPLTFRIAEQVGEERDHHDLSSVELLVRLTALPDDSRR
jgi:hypothetical protein